MEPELFAQMMQDPHYVEELGRLTELYPPDADGFVRLEEVSVYELNSTAQYTGRHAFPDTGHVYLAEGLDVRGDLDRFSGIEMKIEDVPVFLDRFQQHKREQIAQRLGRIIE